MTTIEGNRLIAEFMEVKILTKEEYAKQTGCPDDELINMPEQNVFYHSSWDWLMPVIKKIVGLHLNDYVSTLPIFSDIKIAWKTVVEFIQWYNQNK